MHEFKYRCWFCDTYYQRLPDNSNRCPCCGGPGLRQVHEDLPSGPIVVYPTTSGGVREPVYYAPVTTNPVRLTKRWLYRRFGFWWTTAGVLCLLVFVFWQVWVAFFTKTDRPTPEVAIPSIATSKPFIQPTAEFADFRFYSAKESEALRTQENVVQLAVIGDGYGVRYMMDYAVIVDEVTWSKVNLIFGVTGMNVSDTAITIKVDAQTYELNKEQGFVFASRPTAIYVVALDGTIWEHSYATDILVPVSQAQEALASTITANANLSLTLR